MRSFMYFRWLRTLVGTCLLCLAVPALAQVKISQLPAASAQTGGEILPEYQAGSCATTGGTCGVTTAQLETYISATLLAAQQTPSANWNFTGGLQLDGTSVLQATSTAVIGTFTGTCSAGSYLRGDGQCIAFLANAATVTGAWNFTGGLTVNGAPVLDTTTLSSATTVTGAWNFTGGLQASGVQVLQANSSSVIGTFTGTCNSTTYLRADGTCASPTITPSSGAYATLSMVLSTCSIDTSYQNTDVSSCTVNQSTGVITITFGTAFAGPPTCFSNSVNGDTLVVPQANGITTTGATFDGYTLSGSPQLPGSVAVHCL